MNASKVAVNSVVVYLCLLNELDKGMKKVDKFYEKDTANILKGNMVLVEQNIADVELFEPFIHRMIRKRPIENKTFCNDFEIVFSSNRTQM